MPCRVGPVVMMVLLLLAVTVSTPLPAACQSGGSRSSGSAGSSDGMSGGGSGGTSSTKSQIAGNLASACAQRCARLFQADQAACAADVDPQTCGQRASQRNALCGKGCN